MSSIRSPVTTPRMLALRVTLILQEDKPSTHQNFLVDVGFMSGGQMDKTWYKNDFNHRNWASHGEGSEVLIKFSK
jgi:hypothetical protein